MKRTSGVGLAGALLGGYLLATPGPALAEGGPIDKARGQLEAGKARAAMITLKNFLQDDPDHPAGRLLLGRTYLRMGKLEAAAMALERAAEAGAADRDWRPVMARVRLYQGRPEAVLDVAEVRSEDPAVVRAEMLALRGRARLRLEERDRAAEAFDRALAIRPDYPAALRGQAGLALGDGDLDRAERLLERARAKAPEEAGIWLMTGRLRERQGRGEEAIAAYRRAHRLKPDSRRAAVALARANLRAGNIDAAEKALAAIPEGRQGPLARYLTAVVAVERQDLEGARDILDGLLARHDFPPARLLSGWVAFQQGRYETAADFLERHTNRFATDPKVAKLLAAAHMQQGRPEKALAALEAVQGAAADDPQLRLLAGRAKIAIGDYAAGMADLKAVAAQSPEDASIRSQVAMGYLAAGNSQRAIPEMEKAVELDSDMLGGRLVLALTHLQSGDYAKAAAEARALAEKDPERSVAYNLLGLARQGQGRTEAARAQFRAALKRDAGFHPARLNLARLDVAQGRFQAAGAELDRILERDSGHQGALLLKAGIAERQGDQKARGRWLERAWQANQQSLAPGLMLIRHRLSQGEPLQALKVARTLKDHHPDHPGVLANLAEVQLRTGHGASAVENFRSLTEQQPESARFRYWLARAYLAQERYDEARDQLRQALALGPEQKASLRLLAGLELETGNPERAAEVAQRLQELAPEEAAGYLLAGRAHWRLDAFDAAGGAFEAALERGPSRQAALHLARVRRQQDQPQEAAGLLRDWLADHPADHGARVLLAETLHQLGDLGKAAKAYERVREANPQRADIWNNLAWIYHQQDDDRALRYARKAHDLAPENSAITDTYGWVLVNSGKPERGLRLLQEAGLHAPQVPSIRYHLAIAYRETGQPQAAREELTRILKANPAFPEAEKARRALESLESDSGEAMASEAKGTE